MLDRNKGIGRKLRKFFVRVRVESKTEMKPEEFETLGQKVRLGLKVVFFYWPVILAGVAFDLVTDGSNYDDDKEE